MSHSLRGKTHLVHILLFVAFLASCGREGQRLAERGGIESPSRSPLSSPSPSPSPEPLAFSVDLAMHHNHFLSVEVGGRPAGSQGERRAAEYIEMTFRSTGMETTRQEVKRLDGGTSFNVIGRLAGVDYAGGYVVIGGHYDTVPSSPGGNDNGSGTAVVLALAQSFSGRRTPVEFVAFAAEEIQPTTREHQVGSRFYAGSLSDAALVKAMVSVDMVGAGPTVLVGHYRGFDDTLKREIADLAQKSGIPSGMVTRGDLSDHTPFARRGIPAAWLWSGDHPTLHSPEDTFEIVQPESVDRAGRLALEWLKMRFSLQSTFK